MKKKAFVKAVRRYFFCWSTVHEVKTDFSPLAQEYYCLVITYSFSRLEGWLWGYLHPPEIASGRFASSDDDYITTQTWSELEIKEPSEHSLLTESQWPKPHQMICTKKKKKRGIWSTAAATTLFRHEFSRQRLASLIRLMTLAGQRRRVTSALWGFKHTTTRLACL